MPEVASRAHLQAMVPTDRRALDTAGIEPGDVDAVAVTAGPGLAGALLVGRRRGEGIRARARQAALRRQPPAGARRRRPARARPAATNRCVALLVSGGHSSLLFVPRLGGAGRHRTRRDTVDDAAGEAYDKVARLLGMPFPGGPPIDRAARDGDPTAIDFPRAMRDDPGSASPSPA